MAKHGVVETQRMQAEYDGAKLCSVKFDKETDNGLVFALGDLIDGQREVYEIKPATDADTVEKGKLVLITTPEVRASGKKEQLNEFTNQKDSVGRGTILCISDYFGDTSECFDGTPEVGSFVKTSESGKLAVVKEATGAFGKIVDLYNGKYGIRVLPTQSA